MTVYWIRHGQTFENIKQTFYGDKASNLTPKGIKDLQEIEKDLPKDAIAYCSPASRAIQSIKVLKIEEYQLDKRLKERSMGIWEGLTYKSIHSEYPMLAKEWENNWDGFVIPKGESAKMQYERVRDFIRTLEKQGKDCIVMCHGGTIQMALAYMILGSIEGFFKFKVPPATLCVTTCTNGYWYLETLRHPKTL